jgi:FlaG/FlaF family flagellin (archaellin)
MNKSLIAIALFMAATSAALASGHGRDASYGAGQGSDAAVTFVNAPGGDYIQCDPRNPSSPVRCKTDGW